MCLWETSTSSAHRLPFTCSLLPSPPFAVTRTHLHLPSTYPQLLYSQSQSFFFLLLILLVPSYNLHLHSQTIFHTIFLPPESTCPVTHHSLRNPLLLILIHISTIKLSPYIPYPAFPMSTCPVSPIHSFLPSPALKSCFHHKSLSFFSHAHVFHLFLQLSLIIHVLISTHSLSFNSAYKFFFFYYTHPFLHHVASIHTIHYSIPACIFPSSPLFVNFHVPVTYNYHLNL